MAALLPRRSIVAWFGVSPLLAIGATPPAAAPPPMAALWHWGAQAIRLVVQRQQNPLRAARCLAYLAVALRDGWLAAETLDPRAALAGAHAAAAGVLAHLYPHETAGQFEAQANHLTSRSTVPIRTAQAGWEAGRPVSDALVQRSLSDGAGRVWSPSMRPRDFDGMWQPSPPLNQVNPTEGMAPAWRTWLPGDAHVYEPPTAPRPGEARYEEELREVLAVAQALDANRADAAQRWHLDAGSVTPPGVWWLTAGERLVHDDGSPVEALHTLALLAMAMHDALVHAWRVKLRDWSERPVTAIRRRLAPDFAPLLVTPGFPAYVSGHAAVSAAAAVVLGDRLPQRDEWSGMAREAADSRLWGGIHFRSDNDEGLRLGHSVGTAVLARHRMWRTPT